MLSVNSRRRCLRTALGMVFALPLIAAVPTSADDPPKLAGTWTWKWKDGLGETHRHVLEIEGDGEKMVAMERFDDEKAVKASKIKLDGKKVTIVVERKDRRSVYTGTIANGETINGTVNVTDEGQPSSEYGWTAKKEAGKS